MFTETLSAEDYLNLDRDTRTSECLTDAAILRQVLTANGMRTDPVIDVDDADDDDDERPYVPIKSGFAAMTTAIDCFEQLDSTTSDDLKLLRGLLKKLESAKEQSLVQSRITDCFKKITE